MDTKGNDAVLLARELARQSEIDAELEEYTWRDRRRRLNDERVLREAGILVDTPATHVVLGSRNAARDFSRNHIDPALKPNPYDAPNWQRVAGWLGAGFLVSMTLLLYLVDEIARRS